MPSIRTRLDRFLIEKEHLNNREVRLLLAQKRIIIDGTNAHSMNQAVHKYTKIQIDQKIIQNNRPCYIKLYKPKGIVSATKDSKHKTVIDLLTASESKDLHIAGRLDFNSTGLILLTNDGRWSRKLSSPESDIEKRYHVTVDKPISQKVIDSFNTGIYFAFENITTRPALLIIKDEYSAEVILKEGKYHQIKRMFGHFQIEVLNLHRLSIGPIELDHDLHEGESKHLSPEEIDSVLKE